MKIRAQHISDYLHRRAKRIAKRLYRHPVIGLARLKRRYLSGTTFIGITGSSGKTTTKDLIHEILREEFQTVKSDDTNNQVYSVARALLDVRNHTQFLVQEIGASANNDLNTSLGLLRPDIGVVTNIGLEHFKRFRTREMIAAEKSKLVRCLPPNGTAVLNADDEYVREFAEMTPARVFTYGSHEDCDLRVRNVSSAWPKRLALTLEFQRQCHTAQTQFCGAHMAPCILAALATSLVVGVSIESAIARIEGCSPTLGRMMPHKTASGVQFIRDDWKAPYWSVYEPIDFMKQADAKRKVIIIGTISDMPGTTSTKYRSVAENALEAADIVYFFGPNSHKALRARSIPSGKTLRAFTNFREFAEHLKSTLTQGDLVLLKASGADHLARLVIMYDENLACWRQRCERQNMCDVCPLVT